MFRKLHALFKRLDELLELPNGTSKEEVKKFLKIEKTSKLNHEDLSYLVRFVDNILLEFGIDADEKEKM